MYGGAQGIWVDKARTGKLAENGNGVTVSLTHSGKSYPDDWSEDGVIYHYPDTHRPPGRDVILCGHDDDASILCGDWLLEPMHQAFKQHLFSQIGKDLHFIVERRGFESWARGAGSLVLRHFFASPAQVHTERTLVLS